MHEYELKGKKLLILGGAYPHCQIVEAARRMGVISYVADYLAPEDSPAKGIADHHCEINVFDIEALAAFCRDEGIHGILSTHLDACQRPYQQLCQRMDMPCYGTKEQFFTFTNKDAFKVFLKENGIDSIPEYSEADFVSKARALERVCFPVFVKPSESCNSKGSRVCHNYEEVLEAIQIARKTSANGMVIIEKFMDACEDISVTMLVLNGKVYIERVADRIKGRQEDGLDRYGMYCPWPARSRKIFVEKVFPKLAQAVLRYGINNAPLFMQGFVDGDTVRFYDPGLRFPGINYESVYKEVFASDVLDFFIIFALTGHMPENASIPEDAYEFGGQKASGLYYMLRSGTIGRIEGMEDIRTHKHILRVYQRYPVGKAIEKSGNSHQSVAEFYILAPDEKERRATLDFIYDTLRVYDQSGEDMSVSHMNDADMYPVYPKEL